VQKVALILQWQLGLRMLVYNIQMVVVIVEHNAGLIHKMEQQYLGDLIQCMVLHPVPLWTQVMTTYLLEPLGRIMYTCFVTITYKQELALMFVVLVGICLQVHWFV
jgi:hypothetical protein